MGGESLPSSQVGDPGFGFLASFLPGSLGPRLPESLASFLPLNSSHVFSTRLSYLSRQLQRLSLIEAYYRPSNAY